MSKISLRQFECFLTLAETLHFGRAAARLGMAQPPLSRMIRRMEAAVGGPLFERHSRRIRLTATGYAMLEPARRVMDDARHAEDLGRQAAAGRTGRLVVGFSSSAAYTVLPGILRQYRNEYPEVELSLRELSTATQLAQLNTGLLDVGVARGPVVDSALTAGVIHRDHFLAVLPEGHRLSARDEIPLRDLSGERFVMFPVRAAPAFHQSILQAFGSAGFTPSIAEEASEWHTIVGLVSVGLGVAIAPAFVSRMGWSNVALRPLSHCSLRAELVVAHSQANTSPLVAGFRRVAERMAGG